MSALLRPVNVYSRSVAGSSVVCGGCQFNIGQHAAVVREAEGVTVRKAIEVSDARRLCVLKVAQQQATTA
ncbi:MAG: hypothetical protein ACXW4C_05525 [Nitrospira sp.]